MDNIEEKVIELIKSREEGILQKELWKLADIDRRKCSRIVDKLNKERKIIREPETSKGSRTYRIKFIEARPKKVRNFRLLLVGDMFSPCAGCNLECFPEHCPNLSDWVFYLIDER